MIVDLFCLSGDPKHLLKDVDGSNTSINKRSKKIFPKN